MKIPRQLPPKYARECQDGDKALTIADYIAGMTDRFAILEYKKLFDPLRKSLTLHISKNVNPFS